MIPVLIVTILQATPPTEQSPSNTAGEEGVAATTGDMRQPLPLAEGVNDPLMASQELERLRGHLRLWRANSSGNYDFTYRRSAYIHEELLRPLRVEVRHFKVVEIRYLTMIRGSTDPREILLEACRERARRYSPPHGCWEGSIDFQLERWILTIEALFEHLRRALESREFVRVEYDHELGFPSEAFVDDALIPGQPAIADNEVTFFVEDVEIVPDDA